MAIEPTRAELRTLAEEALRDAQILLGAQSWSFAYYLAGYAVELGIKACIAQTFKADTIPDKTRVQNTYRHKLTELMKEATLDDKLRDRQQADGTFTGHWGTVKDWSPEYRYRVNSEQEARDLINAISDADHGILPWIRAFW